MTEIVCMLFVAMVAFLLGYAGAKLLKMLKEEHKE